MLVKVVGTPLIHLLSLLAQATSFIPEVPAKKPVSIVQEKTYEDRAFKIELYNEWKRCIITGKYDEALVAEKSLGCCQTTMKNLVIESCNAELAKAYVYYIAHTEPKEAHDCWVGLFSIWSYRFEPDKLFSRDLNAPDSSIAQLTSAECKLAFSKALWQQDLVCKFFPKTGLPTNFEFQLMMAISDGDSAYMRWAITILKEKNRLSMLNERFDFPPLRRLRWEHETKDSDNRVWLSSGVHFAAYLGYLDMVTLLLQFGAKPIDLVCECDEVTKTGTCPHKNNLDELRYPSPWAYNCDIIPYTENPNKKKITQLIKFFLFFRPRIIELILNDACKNNKLLDTEAARNHLLARRAFYLCPALASEFIVDAEGNNPLHCAVLAENSFLIKLLLTINPLLIDSKNSNTGLSPLTLAYSKNLHAQLKAIIEYAYAIHEKPFQKSSIFN